MKVAIFGSSGVVNDAFIMSCQSHSFSVSVFGRKMKGIYFFDLYDRSTWPTKLDYDLCINLAWDMNARKSYEQNSNISFALYIQALSISEKTQVLFISSISAKENSYSFYGKSKYLVEQKTIDSGGKVLKIAFIDSTDTPSSKNLSQVILSSVRMLPIRLIISNMPPIPTVTKEYLIQELNKILINPNFSTLPIIESRISAENFFSEPGKKIKVQISRQFVGKLFAILAKWKFIPVPILDRWLSLEDSTSLSEE